MNNMSQNEGNFKNGLPAMADGLDVQTMTSREIADICDARHNDVVATILRLFEKGVLRESRKTTRPYFPEGGGRPTEVYDLTKRDTLVVVSGYDDVIRARIIDRWQELENQTKPRDPMEALNDPSAMRGLLLTALPPPMVPFASATAPRRCRSGQRI